MKKILGLDLGTNSIGWALIEQNFNEKKGKILGLGSRIIPMSQEILGEFDKGNSISQTAERTGYRGIRRLRERELLRRERLHRVLNILKFLPAHYAAKIDFENRMGKFIQNAEPKIAYDDNNQFIFRKSFDEMLADFAKYQPELVNGERKVPYDWTIYFLRKKALNQKIEREELAWILLNFNQKRGYYQLRGEDEEVKENKLEEFHTLKVVDVQDSGDKKGNDIWYNVILENGWIYRRSSRIPLFDWTGKIKEFIVTTELNDDGTIKKDKEGKEKRSFKAVDSEKDWIAIKKSTEDKIDKSKKTVGSYIYETLLQNPNQKIKGKLVRTIERKFYKEELEQILKTQQAFQPELQNKEFFKACIEELYQHNETHRRTLEQKDFVHLFLNDIIFYQRPLKSKKSLISDCRYESRVFIKDGIKQIQPLKCISRSHPLFQEFRLWQWLKNLKIYEVDSEKDVTNNFLKNETDWEGLFEWLSTKKEITQDTFFKYPGFKLKFKKSECPYRWNYVEDKTYPCNETRYNINSRLAKVQNVPDNFLNSENEISLWHILYSVNDKAELFKALNSFAAKNGLSNDFAEQFAKFPPFKNEYGAYSEKAIKKLLPLMRIGKYWSENNISTEIKIRAQAIVLRLDSIGYDINKIENASDDDIPKQILKSFVAIQNPLQGLNTYQACYLAYNRHSEESDTAKWETPFDIEKFLNEFKQHSLRNPIVEQVITETLRVVKDIWLSYGNGNPNFFNEIHIELGRSMKNPAEKRARMTKQNTENENTNLRIKALLAELLNDPSVENVRPYSPSQQEILKIYEDGVLNSGIAIDEDILKISKSAQPTKSELVRYKLWLEQRYRSPYTGEIIPLNKLFTPAYEIEHIIPQSRFFDDSFSNKVICESEVNKDKDNSTAYEYIKENRGKVIELSKGKTVKLLSLDAYENFVKQHYSKNRSKKDKLLMEDIPEKMVERQMNDSRYISKVVKNYLSKIVREEKNDEGTTSNNVLSGSGQITSILKQDWGFNDIWNEIIAPRFVRLNELTNSTNFGIINENTNKFLPQVPLELQKGFNKKRIDHRHHALDALVIALATRSHINYLNNLNAIEPNKNKEEKQKLRHDLRAILCDKKYNEGSEKNYIWVFKKPWETITQEAKETLLTTIVSFKQNLRVINKTVNNYQKWENKNGIPEKVIKRQEKGDSWAIRKPMHKDTVFGSIDLRFKKTVTLSAALDNPEMLLDKSLKAKVKELVKQGKTKEEQLKFFKESDFKWNEKDISKVEVYYFDKENVASRVKLDDSFYTAKIETITDTGIQKILLKHLSNYNESKGEKIIEHPELAFSPEGIDVLNQNIKSLNNGKPHQPILKVRTFEPKGNKFTVGSIGNKKDKYVVAAKGTNLFFAVYQDKKGKRNFETIPLNEVVERQKQGAGMKQKPTQCVVPAVNSKGDNLLFYLSPNDLVYIPTPGEAAKPSSVDFKSLNKGQVERIYKIVSFRGNRLSAVPVHVAKSIVDKQEFTSANKMEFSLDKISIKDVCWKLNINRLGEIFPVKRIDKSGIPLNFANVKEEKAKE
jgi:CRISPR-associated endonuclease Csn1